jgi:hypothetical protein
MIAIIQCAARKRQNAGYLRKIEGTPVMFVADPAKAPPRDGFAYARPDDRSDTGATWREVLLHYNAAPGDNPLGLFRAYELYENPAYRRLPHRFGTDRTYILSAGWGLIRADFLTPHYDITFSAAVKKSAPWKFRRKTDRYEDLRQLPEDTEEPILFFGGKDYVPLFCRLTQGIKSRRTIFYNSGQPLDAPGCALQRFSTTTRTNWHYECANAFLDGQIALEPQDPRHRREG